MADELPPDLIARVERLEKELREVRLRLASLELKMDPRLEHPVDKSTIREKVAYDWQA